MSQAQEGDIATAGAGRVVPASGALPGLDGDVDLPGWLIEAKATRNKSFSVTRKTWDKIAGEAGMAMKKPALALRIDGEDLVVVRMCDFMELKSDE